MWVLSAKKYNRALKLDRLYSCQMETDLKEKIVFKTKSNIL